MTRHHAHGPRSRSQSPPPGRRSARCARGGVAGILGAGVAGLAGLAVTWLVAHRLGPEQAGAFFAATATFVLAGALAKLGTQTGLVYWPARLRARGHAFCSAPACAPRSARSSSPRSPSASRSTSARPSWPGSPPTARAPPR